MASRFLEVLKEEQVKSAVEERMAVETHEPSDDPETVGKQLVRKGTKKERPRKKVRAAETPARDLVHK